MFVAKFQTVSGSDSFKPNKNGKLPNIGTILAGIATASIIDGTIFEREKLEENVAYLCENYIDEAYPEYPSVRVIGKVSMLELLQFRKELGEGRLHRATATEEATAAVATVDESEVVAD